MGYVNNNNQHLDQNQIILGIDQSFSNTGFAVYDCNELIYCSCIATKNDKTLEERIFLIISEMNSIIKKFEIRQVCIEGLSFNSRQASIRQLAGLFYVILNELHAKDIIYDIIPPLTLKKAATGNGRADKSEMINAIPVMTQLFISETTNIKIGSKKFEDLADAYWLSRYTELLSLQ